MNRQRPRSAPSRRLALALLGAFALAVIAGAVLATPTLLPGVPRYAARVSMTAGPKDVLSASEDGARAAALRLASGPEHEAVAARRRLADRRTSWADMPLGPLAPLAQESESAALLRARADLGVTLAGEGPVTVLPPRASVDATSLERADAIVERAALGGTPQELRDALESADRAEQQWLAREPVASERMLRWQSRERARAERFVLAAQVLEIAVTPLQRDLVTQWVPEFALELEPAALATLETAVRSSEYSEPRPLMWLWVSVLIFAAGIGAALGYSLERAFGRPRRAALDPSSVRTPDVWNAHGARLHLVSGESAIDIAAGVAQTAAGFVARGERVVIFDAGRALKLHAPFGDQPRWGLSECLAGDSPLLGVVQRAIVNGLYLLPRGAERRALWPRATSVIDEALSHFGRVIIAVDEPAAESCARALRGRWIEGVWTGTGRRAQRRATELSRRVGIILHPFELKLAGDHLHEQLPALVQELRTRLPRVAIATAPAAREPAAAPRAETVPRPAALDPAPLIAPAAAPAQSAPAIEADGERWSPQVVRVVETDVTTRERLRFLMWMRRVQAERRKRDIPSVA